MWPRLSSPSHLWGSLEGAMEVKAHFGHQDAQLGFGTLKVLIQTHQSLTCALQRPMCLWKAPKSVP